MYSDVVKIKELKQILRIRPEDALVNDLILMSSADYQLSPINNTDSVNANTGHMGAVGLHALKEEIASQFMTDLTSMVGSALRDATEDENDVCNQFVQKCTRTVRRIVLSLPDEVQAN